MYELPEFPPDFPEDMKKKLIEKLDAIDRFSTKWEPILKDFDDDELIAIAKTAMEEAHRRTESKMLDLAANDPRVREKVLASLKDDESVAPEIGEFDINDIIGGRPN